MRRPRSQAVEYFVRAIPGWLSTRIGIARVLRASPSISYPPYMSLSTSRTALIIALTFAEPPLVEPPKKTSSSLAARLSESISILRRSPSRWEPFEGGAGTERSVSTAMASFRVEAAGKRARAFQAAPRPVTRFWTKTPAVPEKARASALTRRASAGSSIEGVSRGAARGGQPEHRTDRPRRRPRTRLADGHEPQSRVAAGKGHLERHAGPVDRLDRQPPAVGEQDGPTGSRRHGSDDVTERHLVGRRLDDVRRLGGEPRWRESRHQLREAHEDERGGKRAARKRHGAESGLVHIRDGATRDRLDPPVDALDAPAHGGRPPP